MNKKDYKRLVSRYIKKPNYKHNIKVAFISGGLLGSICEIIYKLLIYLTPLSKVEASSLITFLMILITSFLTSIGIFDKFITKYRSGLIIPTTGFAHSVSSSLVDSKKEGLITGLGSNMFILAGSVVLYSTIAAFILVIIKVIILCLV